MNAHAPINRPLDDAKPVALIVDDSMDVHRLLKAKLKDEELEFMSAHSGADGVRLACEAQPAIIILDLDMPGMDGLSVIRHLKNDPRTHHIPVVVLSGQLRPEDKVAAFDLGAVDYVTKPFELTELRVRVRSTLRLHKLLQLLAQRAQIDGLTGLWNRAYFDQRWAEEHSRALRQGHALSVAFLDLDNFKLVNDTFGHPVGDMVLQAIAKTLQRECRTSDLACRYGGEEFVLVMPDTGPDDAALVCDRIRAAVERLVWSGHRDLRVTLSTGVAGSTSGGPVSAQDWVEAADRNLYAAKRAGRNRVVVSNLSGATPLRRAG